MDQLNFLHLDEHETSSPSNERFLQCEVRPCADGLTFCKCNCLPERECSIGSSTTTTSENLTGVIVGSILGGMCLIAIAVGIAVYFAIRKRKTPISPGFFTTNQTQVNSDFQQQQQQQPSQSYMYNQHSGYSGIPFSPMQSPNHPSHEIHFSQDMHHPDVHVGAPVYAPQMNELVQSYVKPLDMSHKSVHP